jgi:hypothetical protein
MRAESEYHRYGALAYVAAYDVHRAQVRGRCEPSTGIKPFTGWWKPGDVNRAVRLRETGLPDCGQRRFAPQLGRRRGVRALTAPSPGSLASSQMNT